LIKRKSKIGFGKNAKKSLNFWKLRKFSINYHYFFENFSILEKIINTKITIFQRKFSTKK